MLSFHGSQNNESPFMIVSSLTVNDCCHNRSGQRILLIIQYPLNFVTHHTLKKVFDQSWTSDVSMNELINQSVIWAPQIFDYSVNTNVNIWTLNITSMSRVGAASRDIIMYIMCEIWRLFNLFLSKIRLLNRHSL